MTLHLYLPLKHLDFKVKDMIVYVWILLQYTDYNTRNVQSFPLCTPAIVIQLYIAHTSVASGIHVHV